jgi:hypothetical protein
MPHGHATLTYPVTQEIEQADAARIVNATKTPNRKDTPMKQFIIEAIKLFLSGWMPGLRFSVGSRRWVEGGPCGLGLVAAVGLLGGISHAQQPLVITPDGNATFSGNVAIGGELNSNNHSHLNWPLAIRGRYSYANLLMFEDAAGKERYHINLDKGGFNLLEITDPTTHAAKTRLFIAPKTGSIGIGTDTPTEGKKLDVVGDTQFSGNVNLKGVLTGDRVGIGTPTPMAGKNLDVVGDTQFSGNMNLKGALIAGNPVGNETSDANTRLAVNGDVRIDGKVLTSGTFNGEKPGIKFTVNAGGNQRNATVVDIKDLCGDQDGCHIKVLMHTQKGELRLIAEDIFIADPSWPKPKGGLSGRTQPSDTHVVRDFVLDANNGTTIFDATGWCKGTNFVEGATNVVSTNPTKLGLDTATARTSALPTFLRDKPFRGDDKYKIVFSCNNDVTGDFIIYDR